MNVLVSGCAGFIGSHFCERLLKDGHRVVGLDNLITGDLKNLEPLRAYGEHFLFFEHDITRPFDELDLTKTFDFDVVCNLACPASPLDYQMIPLETLWVSAAGTKNMLEFALRNKALFFHASTSEVYGDPLVHPQTEQYFGNVNCLGPRSCYDEGKRFAESLIVNHQQKFGMRTKIVRIFNTYGPRMRKNDGRVIPNFIVQALKNEPLMIHGDGSQTRSFCYIDDMVDGMIAMLGTEDFSGPVNLGNPEEYSIKRLAEMVIQLTASKSSISYKELPQDDPKVRRPDIHLARERLHFNPQIGLEEGLNKTIVWFS